MRPNALVVIPFLLEATHAFQLPFGIDINLPFFQPSRKVQDTVFAPLEDFPDLSPPRIAIIGAGAAGSSAAFWISKARGGYRLGTSTHSTEYRDNREVGPGRRN